MPINRTHVFFWNTVVYWSISIVHLFFAHLFSSFNKSEHLFPASFKRLHTVFIRNSMERIFCSTHIDPVCYTKHIFCKISDISRGDFSFRVVISFLTIAAVDVTDFYMFACVCVYIYFLQAFADIRCMWIVCLYKLRLNTVNNCIWHGHFLRLRLIMCSILLLLLLVEMKFLWKITLTVSKISWCALKVAIIIHIRFTNISHRFRSLKCHFIWSVAKSTASRFVFLYFYLSPSVITSTQTLVKHDENKQINSQETNRSVFLL